MTLIVLLACLALQYFTNTTGALPRFDWMRLYTKSASSFLDKSSLWGSIWGLLALLIPPLFVVGLIDLVLHAKVFGLMEFLFSLIILLYCMYAENLRFKLQPYFEALSRQDFNAANQAAEDYLIGKLPTQPAELCRSITQLFFDKALVQVFSYLFWFAILGVYGVTIYYVVSSLRRLASENNNIASPFLTIAKQAQAILDWIPLRLAGLSYALVGHFANGFGYWLKHLFSGIDANPELTWKFGLAALNKDPNDLRADLEENKASITLVHHAVIVWLVAIALVVVCYWMA